MSEVNSNQQHHTHISSEHKLLDLNLKEVWKYRDLIIELSTFLNNNGELYYGYYYDDNDKNLDYYYKEIPNTDIIKIPKSNKKMDKVLVLKK